MSIYATVLLFDATENNRWGPIRYQGSHVLPADDDTRQGWVEFAQIPGHITRDGREKAGDGPWPWIRVSINDEAVVLDRAQVAELNRFLKRWLARTDASGSRHRGDPDVPDSRTTRDRDT